MDNATPRYAQHSYGDRNHRQEEQEQEHNSMCNDTIVESRSITCFF